MVEFIGEQKRKANIKVIGVGGCGCNAVNHMSEISLHGHVSLVAVNTDTQSLDQISDKCTRVQIGHAIAGGLGVGGNYAKAEEAARKDSDRLRENITGADMVFLAAGMGGGTGTGAAPVIAEICKEHGILTVAVVIKPFDFENRDQPAAIGLKNLSKHVDSLIIVPNDKASNKCEDNVSMVETMKITDSVLINSVTGICEIIDSPGHINVDFADVRMAMSERGQAVIGTAKEAGPDRASCAAEAVLYCPLLEGVDITTAKAILVNISGTEKSVKTNEVKKVMEIIKNRVPPDAKVFLGSVYDEKLGDFLRITLVATGLGNSNELRTVPNPGGGTGSGAGMYGQPLACFRNANKQGKKLSGNVIQPTLSGIDTSIPTCLKKNIS